jgi:hypothetical protein
MRTVSIITKQLVRLSFAAVFPALTAVPLWAQAPALRAPAETQQSMETQAKSEVQTLFGPLTPDARAQLAAVARAGIEKAARRVLVERAVIEPLTSGTLSASQQQVTVVADKGDVSGHARFSIPLGPTVDGQITLTAPLTGSSATFANTAGVAPNASVNGSLKWTIWTRTQTITTNVAPLSAAIKNATGVETGSPTDQLLAGLEIARRAAATSRPASLLATSVTGAGYSALGRIVASPSLTATPERFYAALVQQLPQLTSTEWAGYVSGGVVSNHHSVDYLTESDFATKTFDKTTQMATISGGVSRMGQFKVPDQEGSVKRPLFFAGAAFNGGNGISVADTQKICRPSGTGGASDCVEGPVGEPTTASTITWTVEARFWSWGALQSVGFNPRYTHSRAKPDSGDIKTVQTVETPIYFMQQVKDVANPDITFGADLIGGVSVGWRQTRTPTKVQEGVFVTLFLTKAFGLP